MVKEELSHISCFVEFACILHISCMNPANLDVIKCVCYIPQKDGYLYTASNLRALFQRS